jgi:hypothetical protein
MTDLHYESPTNGVGATTTSVMAPLEEATAVGVKATAGGAQGKPPLPGSRKAMADLHLPTLLEEATAEDRGSHRRGLHHISGHR